MEQKQIYCLKCKKHTDNQGTPVVKEINTRPSLTAKCSVCGTSKHVFIKKISFSAPEKDREGEESKKDLEALQEAVAVEEQPAV